MTEIEYTWSYEEAANRLEEAVQRLEQGELSLEESLKCFEEAVGLVNYCKKLLTKAEQRLMILIEDEDGDLNLEPLSFPEENE